MPDVTKLALAELISFLEAYSLGKTIASNREFKTLLRSLYKRHHALLVWHTDLHAREVWEGNGEKDATFREYLGEATSDVCQSVLLFAQGLYKPAYLVLRSAIENFIRCIGIAGDQAVLSLSSVFELMAVVRDTRVVRQSTTLLAAFDKLRRVYGELCSYVHSSEHEYMSLTAYLGVYPRFNEQNASDFAKVCRDVIVSFCGALTLLFSVRFRELHHRDMDVIADILPRQVKSELYGATLA
jgi:hypothetical protein